MIKCENCDATNRVGAQFCRECGAELYGTVEILPDVVAQGRYKVLGLLGKGGHGRGLSGGGSAAGGQNLGLEGDVKPFFD